MKFKLSASGTFYNNKDKEKLEKLGFEFKTTKEVYGEFVCEEWYLDDDVNTSFIEIKTLKELNEFAKEWGEIVVSNENIEIYNDNREG